MTPQVVVEEAEKNGVHFLYANDGALYSIKPPESMFGYTYWSHLIPPFKPEHTLILGYGGGVVAELMRKIWGPCKITGVDIEPSKNDYRENRMKIMDAKEFVWDATADKFFKNKVPLFGQVKYDYICIDLWNGKEVPWFVFDTEFVVRLRELSTKLVAMNISETDFKKCKSYYDYGFKFDRFDPVEGNRVVWWSVNG